MANLRDPRKSLLGILALYKRVSIDKRLKTRQKICDSKTLQKSKELLKKHPNFQVLILQLLTAMLSNPFQKLFDIIASLFWDDLLKLMKDPSSKIVIYSVNIIHKIVRGASPSRKLNTQPFFCSLLKRILEINEDISERPILVLAVKYRTFNALLNYTDRSSWKDYGWDWITLTSKAMHHGLIRDYRNLDFEAWIQD